MVFRNRRKSSPTAALIQEASSGSFEIRSTALLSNGSSEIAIAVSTILGLPRQPEKVPGVRKAVLGAAFEHLFVDGIAVLLSQRRVIPRFALGVGLVGGTRHRRLNVLFRCCVQIWAS